MIGYSSGPYELMAYYSQRAFDRDYRAATIERPGGKFEKALHRLLIPKEGFR